MYTVQLADLGTPASLFSCDITQLGAQRSDVGLLR